MSLSDPSSSLTPQSGVHVLGLKLKHHTQHICDLSLCPLPCVLQDERGSCPGLGMDRYRIGAQGHWGQSQLHSAPFSQAAPTSTLLGNHPVAFP